jgi:stage V sporulation protein G
MLAVLSITIDDCFAIHDIKIVRGGERVFVAMPCRKDEKGVYHDIVHPINAETRTRIEGIIMDAYNEHVNSLGEDYFNSDNDNNQTVYPEEKFGEQV